MQLKEEIKQKLIFWKNVVLISTFISLLIYFLVSTKIVQVFQIDTSYQITFGKLFFIQFGY